MLCHKRSEEAKTAQGSRTTRMKIASGKSVFNRGIRNELAGDLTSGRLLAPRAKTVAFNIHVIAVFHRRCCACSKPSGSWRSGTTLLHELLAMDDQFGAPTTYACFNPHQFLLTRHRLPAATPIVRPAGDMTILPSSPQEEEFALFCMSATSPYEAFMFPSGTSRSPRLSFQ